MTQIPAGWYPDPAPAEPGRPPTQRWWDGSGWTDHVQPAPGEQAPVEQSYGERPAGTPSFGTPSYGADAYGTGTGTYGTAPYRGPAYPASPGAGYGRAVPSTPDGQRLAGWGARLAAYLMDSVLRLLIAVLVGFPIVSRLAGIYRDYVDAALRAAENGSAAPSQSALLGDALGPLLAFTAVRLAVNLVYTCGFLKYLSATPGKLALRLQVRRRDRPGRMSWGTVLLRWLVQNLAGLVGWVPVLSLLSAFYPLLDCLWPLWDRDRQALHDKAARTNVVVRDR